MFTATPGGDSDAGRIAWSGISSLFLILASMMFYWGPMGYPRSIPSDWRGDTSRGLWWLSERWILAFGDFGRFSCFRLSRYLGGEFDFIAVVVLAGYVTIIIPWLLCTWFIRILTLGHLMEVISQVHHTEIVSTLLSQGSLAPYSIVESHVICVLFFFFLVPLFSTMYMCVLFHGIEPRTRYSPVTPLNLFIGRAACLVSISVLENKWHKPVEHIHDLCRAPARAWLDNLTRLGVWFVPFSLLKVLD